MPVNGLVTIASAFDVPTTLERFSKAVEAKGITIFARIDHAAGAASVGLTLPPTTVVIFGNPVGGTPLMQSAQTAGIDLPLKVLVWQDTDGITRLSYNDPVWIAARHGIGNDAQAAVSALTSALTALARQATQGD